ncbi:cobalamin B12-binding domain-containing protein [Saccharomonospora saliphila]|uniref:cobalamin B12-binding domain-containing protein n=1 Tax=Saccharomonospora saliphila TaxID=369829 RepID=UPI00036EA503|nr:cobalamin-dependent protein [Saccharomonospora saliphila]
MGPGTEPPELLGPFEHALERGDSSAASALVDRVLDAGASPVSVLCDVVAPAQRRIGERWQSGEWSVAQEHIATGISVAVTEAVARRARRLPVTRGRVVVGCPEREWHALAALVVGTGLRQQGWQVTYLGASTPADRLASHLHHLDPTAVAVSCSMAGGLPTARRFIEAATTVGIPVLAGGAAFGTDDRRARALGATAWAPSLPDAFELVERLPATVDPADPLPAAPLAEQRTLELAHHRLVEQVTTNWAPVRGRDDDVDGGDLSSVVHDCVEQPLRTLQAALLTGDERLVSEIGAWVRAVLRARSVPETAVAGLGEELLAAVSHLPLTRELLRAHWPGADRATR